MIGLAKREEQIVIHHTRSHLTLNKQKLSELQGHYMTSDTFTLINLPHDTHIMKLLQRIRDESHRFAVSYHTVLKRNAQTKSLLDDIPGVGPVTRKKLLKVFGSVRGIRSATDGEIAKIVGEARAAVIRSHLG